MYFLPLSVMLLSASFLVTTSKPLRNYFVATPLPSSTFPVPCHLSSALAIVRRVIFFYCLDLQSSILFFLCPLPPNRIRVFLLWFYHSACTLSILASLLAVQCSAIIRRAKKHKKMRFFLHTCKFFTTFATANPKFADILLKAFALFEDSFNHPHIEFTFRE